MADDNTSFYDELVAQQNAIAAPEGLRQQAAARAREAGPGGLQDLLQPWSSESYARRSNEWVGGQNVQGTNSGWEVDYVSKTMDTYSDWMKKVDESRKSDDPKDWLAWTDMYDKGRNPGAEGLVTWDDPRGRWKAGDYIRNGAPVEGQNVYELWDDDTANQIMGQFMFDADEEKDFYSDSDPVARVSREVREKIEEQSRQAEFERSALDYQADVAEEQERFLPGGEESWRTYGMTAAGAGGGAAGGATVGAWLGTAVFPGLGTAVGAGLGALAGTAWGGTSAWLNQDQLTEVMARASVEGELARDRYDGTQGWLVDATSETASWGELLFRSISPLSNTVQGLADQRYGDVGDGRAEFYELDSGGNRKVSGWWRAADLAATLGDAVLQFSTPYGAAAFQGSMALRTGSQAAQMVFTGWGADDAAGFNTRTGQWDSYEGAEFAYALGTIGIDALQMWVAHGVMRQGAKARDAFSTEPRRAYDDQTIDAMRFSFGADGTPERMRIAWSQIAVPSNQLKFVSVSRRARQFRNARLAGAPPASAINGHVPGRVRRQIDAEVVAPTADDYFRAAQELSRGGTFKDALINGFAEGYEEGVQGFLEPRSFGETATGAEIVEGALYGLAAGTGMSLSSSFRGPDAAQRQESRALGLYMVRKGVDEVDPAEWQRIYWGEGVTERDRRRMTLANPAEAKKLDQLMQGYRMQFQFEQSGSPVGAVALGMNRWSKFVKMHENRDQGQAGSRVIGGFEGTLYTANGMQDIAYRNDSVVQSLRQTESDLEAIWSTLQARQAATQEAADGVRAEMDAAAAAGDTSRQAERQAVLDDLQARLDQGRAQMVMLKDVRAEVTAAITAVREAATQGDRRARVKDLNDLLLAIYDKKWDAASGTQMTAENREAAKRLVELMVVRHPTIHAGADDMSVPQVSLLLEDLGMHATSYMDQSRIAKMGADHDGDQGILQTDLDLPESVRDQLRRGTQYLVPKTTEEVVYELDANGDVVYRDDAGNIVDKDAEGAQPHVLRTLRGSKLHVNMDPPDGHRMRAAIMGDALTVPTSDRGRIVLPIIESFRDILTLRYTQQYDIYEQDELRRILDDWQEAVARGDEDADGNLLDDLVNSLNGIGFLDLPARTNERSELLFVKQELAILHRRVQYGLSAEGAQRAEPLDSSAYTPPPPRGTHSGMTGTAVRRATTTGFSLSLLLEYTVDMTRQSQHMHYDPFFSAAITAAADRHRDPKRGLVPETHDFLVAAFARFGTNKVGKALDLVTNKYAVEYRVYEWMQEYLEAVQRQYPWLDGMRGPEAIMMLGSVAVTDIVYNKKLDRYEVTDNDTTLIQLLLRKSVEIERAQLGDLPPDDPRTVKLARLDAVTRRKGDHSTTGLLAFKELFGNIPAHRLMPQEEADAIGANMTMNQLGGELAGLSVTARRDREDKLKGLPGATMGKVPRHDPPYTLEEMARGDVSALSLFVDTAIVEGRTAHEKAAERDKTSSNQVRTILTQLWNRRGAWAAAHHDRLQKDAVAAGKSSYSDEDAMNDMLLNDVEAQVYVAQLVPEEAVNGVWRRKSDGSIWQARWLGQVLNMKDPALAEKKLWVNSKIATLNVEGGKLRMSVDMMKERRDKKRRGEPVPDLNPSDLIAAINPAELDSRFLQMLVMVLSEPDGGLRFDQLLEHMAQDEPLDQFLDWVNNQSGLMGSKQGLLAYHDDVSMYEPKLDQTWNATGRSQTYRDSLDETASRLAMQSSTYAEDLARSVGENDFTKELAAYYDLPVDQRPSHHMDRYATMLTKAVALAKLVPDQLGYAARDQFLHMLQLGLAHYQDKGKPPDAVVPVGTLTITQIGLGGYRAGISKEAMAQSSFDWNAVRSNLSAMIDGPVRIMLDNGRVLELDLSTPEAVARMLADPVTRAFARAVLFSTVRNVGANGQLQNYKRTPREVDDPRAALTTKELLIRSQMGHLWPSEPTVRLSLAQADELAAMADAAMMKIAQGPGSDATDRSLRSNMVLRVISDLLQVYMHADNSVGKPKKQVRDDALQSSMTLLYQLAAFKRNYPHLMERLHDELVADLQARFMKDSFSLENLEMTQATRVAIQASLVESAITKWSAELVALNQRIDDYRNKPNFDPATDPAYKEDKERLDWLNARLKEMTSNEDAFDLSKLEVPPNVEAVLNLWLQPLDTLTGDDLAAHRADILEFLNRNDRLQMFHDKKTDALFIKASQIMLRSPRKMFEYGSIKPDEWKVLAEAAATAYVAEFSTAQSSSVGMRMLSAKDPNHDLHRYYDRSYSYMLDLLFDDTLLDVVGKFMELTPHNPPNILKKDIVQTVRQSFLPGPEGYAKVSEWTPLLVGESWAGLEALRRSTVYGDIQRHGVLPGERQDSTGSAKYNLQLPPEDPNNPLSYWDVHSEATIPFNIPQSGVLPPVETAIDLVDPHLALKLDRHFISRLEVTSSKGTSYFLWGDKNTKPPASFEMWGTATTPWLKDVEVSQNGYEFLELQRLNEALRTLVEHARQNGDDSSTFEISIEYVDMEKKPADVRYANSIYFNGVGRQGISATEPNPLAEMLFGPGGDSDLGQQGPLDAAKGGANLFWESPTTSLNVVKGMEAGFRTQGGIYRVIMRKVRHMYGKQYETGWRLPGDNNALIQDMKLRHVVRGKDAEGNWVYLWSDEAISLDHKDKLPFDRNTMELIFLSEAVLQSLLGKSGELGAQGDLVPPRLNPNTLPARPKLTMEYLRSKGLERLGDTVEANNTREIMSVAELPVATMATEGRGEFFPTDFEESLRTLGAAKAKVHNVRNAHEGDLKISESRKENLRFLRGKFRDEKDVHILEMLSGIPMSDMVDLSDTSLSNKLTEYEMGVIDDKDPRMLFKFGFYDSAAGNRATITPAVLNKLDETFAFQEGSYAVTYQDVVAIDLDNIQATMPNRARAKEEVMKAIRVFAQRGATIVLAASTAQGLRSDIVQILNTGEDRLRPQAGSAHIFAPTEVRGVNMDALASTLAEARPITALDMRLMAITDQVGVLGGNENAALTSLEDLEALRYERLQRILIPAQLTNNDGSGRQKHWGLPQGGGDKRGSKRAALEWLSSQFQNPEFIPHILRMYGQDLPDHLLTRKVDGKYDNLGALPIQEAIDRLKEDVAAGKIGPYEGQNLILGDFVLLVSRDGDYMLTRYGFQIPAESFMDQINTPLGGTEPVSDGTGAGFAVAINKLQDEQTVPPPVTITNIDYTPDGMSVTGRYATAILTKMVLKDLAYKAGLTIFPEDIAPPQQAMSRNGFRPLVFMSRMSMIAKQAMGNSVRNFRMAFALFGVDFTEDMVRFFYGPELADPNHPDHQTYKEKTWRILSEWADISHSATVMGLRTILSRGDMALKLQVDLQGLVQNIDPTIDMRRLFDLQRKDAQESDYRLAEIILTTLMLPGIGPEHVLSTPGVLTLDSMQSDAQIMLMPKLMTEALADPRWPNLRNGLIDRLNAGANWPTIQNRNGDVPVYVMNDDFTFNVMMRNPETGVDLQWEDVTILLAEPLPADKDAANISASQISRVTSASPHAAAVMNATLDGFVSTKPSETGIGPNPGLYGPNEIIYFENDNEQFYDLFNRIQNVVTTVDPWRRKFPMEMQYYNRARPKYKAYQQPIDRAGWTDAGRKRAHDLTTKMLDILGLPASEAYEIDILVRQFLGNPGAANAGDIGRTDQIHEGDYADVVEMMIQNLEDHMHPLHTGYVFIEREAFWSKVFHAQAGRSGEKWSPMKSKNGNIVEFAGTWDEWAVSLFGQARHSNQEFEPLFRLDNDAFLHTWTMSSPSVYGYEMSRDAQTAAMLIDPATNEMILSLDSGVRSLLNDPIITDVASKTIDNLLGDSSGLDTPGRSKNVPAAVMHKRVQHIQSYRAVERVPRMKKTSAHNFYREGLESEEKSRNTSPFLHFLSLLQVSNRLFNPALWVSALMEIPVKNFIEYTVDVFTGDFNSVLALPGTRLKEWALDTRFGARAEEVANRSGLNIRPRTSLKDKLLMRKIARGLARKTEFRAELIGELVYNDLIKHMPAGKAMERAEKITAMIARGTADPTLGMLPTGMALRYVQAAWEYINATDMDISLEQMAAELGPNPLWLKTQFDATGTSPHQLGVNRNGRIRGTKQSGVNIALMSWIDRMENEGAGPLRRGAGFMLNVPFRFKRFNAGALLSMTGLSAVDELFSMMRDARPTGSVSRRMQEAMLDEGYIPQEFTDYSQVLDAVDLSRSFVRMGVTHSMLLAAGLWAGGLSLDGEDEEAKRRRRMAQYLNAPLYLDPRRAENDVAFADAIFLDGIAPLTDVFEDGNEERSYILPHWIFRQFTSPMMGVQRFLNTGDPMELWSGFGDAIAAIPYTAQNVINDAYQASSLLFSQADDELAKDGQSPESAAAVSKFFIGGAMVLEKALVENSFINGIRNASDAYDRDPFVLVARDETTNDIIRENGQPAASDALVDVAEYDVEGNPIPPRQAYEKRADDWSLRGARSHAYAENNAVYAFVATLFTGQVTGDSSFARRNMAVKERTVDLEPSTKAQVEALVLSAYRSYGGSENMTLQEIEGVVKAKYEAADLWWDSETISQEAEALYESMNGAYGAYSLLDEDGYEVIQQAGMKSVYRSLYDEAIPWDSAVLRGINADIDMRNAIAVEFLEELMQESIDNGMTPANARYRVNRIWYGDDRHPEQPGLKKILYDDRIPYNNEVRYRQLNVTYTLGPDGRPYATPFSRQNLWQVLGIPVPHSTPATGPSTSLDARGKVVDDALGINTGMSGLEPLSVDPGEVEGALTDDEVKAILDKDYVPNDWENKKYGRRSYGFGGGGGGSSYFSSMRALPGGTSPRIDRLPAINTSNPYTRRANVNRQRIWFERGRLKEWQ